MTTLDIHNSRCKKFFNYTDCYVIYLIYYVISQSIESCLYVLRNVLCNYVISPIPIARSYLFKLLSVTYFYKFAQYWVTRFVNKP